MDQSREETLPAKIKKIRKYLDDMKSHQYITGDSWVLYRYTGTWDTSGGDWKYLVFRTYNTRMRATVKLAQETTFYMYPLGVRSENGVYFWVCPPWFTNMPYTIDSTQPGVVSVETRPPF